MKFRILLSFLLLFSINIMGQNNIVRQKCATCGKAKSQCPYKGNHPKCSTCGKVISKCQYKGKHPVPKKCATCGKEISKCQYKGNHPVPKKCATCGKEVSKCQYKGDHPTGFDVTFTCNVPTATVYIDGKDSGVASGKKYMTIGHHVIMVTASGCDKFEQDFKIDEDNKYVSITLKKRKVESPAGKLVVTSNPFGATVYVDRKEVGKTPLTLSKVAVGQHIVELTLPGYMGERKYVEVSEGKTASLSYTLQQPDSPTTSTDSQGYFRNSGFYVSPGLQVGSLTAIGVSVGGYINKFNIEGYYNYGISESDKVYWTQQSSSSSYSVTYKPSCYGVKVGYGLLLANNFRLTPQLGIGAVSLSGKADGNNKAFNGSATSFGIGCKAEYAFLPYMCVGLAPELDMAISKSDTYTKISDATSSVNSWASGFNCRIFLSLFF